MSEKDVQAAMTDAHAKAEQHQQQGTGTFVREAHASQQGRPDHKDPGNMGQPKGKGQ